MACTQTISNIETLLSDEDILCHESELLQNLRLLRNSCIETKNQEIIASNKLINTFLHELLFKNTYAEFTHYHKVQTMAWQLLSNAIAINETTQRILWEQHGEAILQHCAMPPLNEHTEIKLMILYNIFKGGTSLLCVSQVLVTVVRVWRAILAEKCDNKFEYLHFIFECLLVQNGITIVGSYSQLNSSERIAFLDYLHTYLLYDSPNGLVHELLLKYLCREFKRKSDCILRQSVQQVDGVNPREVYNLLRVIGTASGCKEYASVYTYDHSLFLNVSSLLRCLVAAGKEDKNNIFTPMQKLEEVAPTSNISHEFESEVSFELKTLLIRCIANLLFKNITNQGYCIDTQLMPAILECTNMDARNPLMKEWSILAIRNACDGCPEIQQIIANLSNQGEAENNLVSEINMKMGSMRIKSSKQ